MKLSLDLRISSLFLRPFGIGIDIDIGDFIDRVEEDEGDIGDTDLLLLMVTALKEYSLFGVSCNEGYIATAFDRTFDMTFG